MSALNVFTYAHQQVRTVVVDGAPWFVAADVARILGYRMASDMTRRLDSDEKGTHSARTPGGEQEVSVISEAGLYIAILGSQIESAREFKRWVTREVLPAIRRTGQYAVTPAPEFQIPSSFAEALELAASQARELEQTTAALEVAEERIAIDAPKAEAFDAFLSTTGDYSLNEAAKILSRDYDILTGEKRLRDWMLDNGWVYRDASRKPRAYQTRVDQRVLAEKPQWHYHPTSGEKVTDTPQVRVTPKGIDRLRILLGSAVA